MTTQQRGRRHLPKQIRMNFRGARRPSSREVDEAVAEVRRSGVVDVIASRLRRRPDAEARLSLFGYEVALTLRGYEKAHQMHLVDVVRLINTLDHTTLRRLRMPNWTYVGCYDRFQRLHARVSSVLGVGWRHVDPATGQILKIDRDWYRTEVQRAAVALDLVVGCALTVDGTPMPTWGRLHGDTETINLDGEVELDEEDE